MRVILDMPRVHQGTTSDPPYCACLQRGFHFALCPTLDPRPWVLSFRLRFLLQFTRWYPFNIFNILFSSPSPCSFTFFIERSLLRSDTYTSISGRLVWNVLDRITLPSVARNDIPYSCLPIVSVHSGHRAVSDVSKYHAIPCSEPHIKPFRNMS